MFHAPEWIMTHLRITFNGQTDIDRLSELHGRSERHPPIPEIIRRAIAEWLGFAYKPTIEWPASTLFESGPEQHRPIRNVDEVSKPSLRSGVLTVRVDDETLRSLREICRREKLRLDQAMNNALALYELRIEHVRARDLTYDINH